MEIKLIGTFLVSVKVSKNKAKAQCGINIKKLLSTAESISVIKEKFDKNRPSKTDCYLLPYSISVADIWWKKHNSEINTFLLSKNISDSTLAIKYHEELNIFIMGQEDMDFGYLFDNLHLNLEELEELENQIRDFHEKLEQEKFLRWGFNYDS